MASSLRYNKVTRLSPEMSSGGGDRVEVSQLPAYSPGPVAHHALLASWLQLLFWSPVCCLVKSQHSLSFCATLVGSVSQTSCSLWSRIWAASRPRLLPSCYFQGLPFRTLGSFRHISEPSFLAHLCPLHAWLCTSHPARIYIDQMPPLQGKVQKQSRLGNMMPTGKYWPKIVIKRLLLKVTDGHVLSFTRKTRILNYLENIHAK